MGTYYCIPAAASASLEARRFMQALTSAQALCYFSTPEAIFSQAPPAYQVIREAGGNGGGLPPRLTKETVYHIMDSKENGSYPDLNSYATFAHVRRYACKPRAYNWRELYPELLALTVDYLAGTLNKTKALDGFTAMMRTYGEGVSQ